MIENRRVDEYVKLTPGINQSRREKYGLNECDEFYDQSSFESDFENMTKSLFNNNEQIYDPAIFVNEGDILISNSMQLATVVSSNNAGKVLSLNFIKVEFDDTLLDKGYFIYIFNAYKGFQRQKERESQGSGSVLRLTLTSISRMIIPYPPFDKQRRIGESYLEMLNIQKHLRKYTTLIEQLTLTIMEDNLND